MNDEADVIFPIWMNIVMEIERDLNLNRDINRHIYHYTNIDAFISIMQNRDFWVSNIHYMNDEHEFEDGRTICKDMLRTKLRVCETGYKKFYENLLNVCDENSSRGVRRINIKDIFALSFCDSGDLLTQWQVYGEDGIAIGFDNDASSFDAITLMDEDQYREETLKINPHDMYPHDERRLLPQNIIYDTTRKKEVISKILDIGERFIRKYGIELEDLCIEGISDALFYYFALMKDTHFSHEHEKRFLCYIGNESERIHFRTRGNIILPYLKFKILDVNCRPHDKFPISDIVISPGNQQEYMANSVKYFLEKSGYEYLVDKVRISEIPFRK